MTPFQIVSLLVFLCVAGVVYSRELKKALLDVVALLTPVKKAADKPTAVDLVSDMVTVAELRDRLNILDCQDGVDACTVLLRVMVEFKPDRGEA